MMNRYLKYQEEKREVDAKALNDYETAMLEWQAMEALVKQRAKGQTLANGAPLDNGKVPLCRKESSLSNEV